jgi:hypothetical protein
MHPKADSWIHGRTTAVLVEWSNLLKHNGIIHMIDIIDEFRVKAKCVLVVVGKQF